MAENTKQPKCCSVSKQLNKLSCLHSIKQNADIFWIDTSDT